MGNTLPIALARLSEHISTINSSKTKIDPYDHYAACWVTLMNTCSGSLYTCLGNQLQIPLTLWVEKIMILVASIFDFTCPQRSYHNFAESSFLFNRFHLFGVRSVRNQGG